MVAGNLRINRENLSNWLKIANLTESALALEIKVDQGAFSKMLNREIPTPKHVIEKILGRTLLPVNSILIFEPDTNGGK